MKKTAKRVAPVPTPHCQSTPGLFENLKMLGWEDFFRSRHDKADFN